MAATSCGEGEFAHRFVGTKGGRSGAVCSLRRRQSARQAVLPRLRHALRAGVSVVRLRSGTRSALLRGLWRCAGNDRAGRANRLASRRRLESRWRNAGCVRCCSVTWSVLTPLSESRDPEVRELLSRYFDAARTVIGRYGGVVEKFIGDAVMAVWGTPVAHRGRRGAGRYGPHWTSSPQSPSSASKLSLPDLAARAGVVTGEVAVTLGATGEGMVAGDAVNTAARVQSRRRRARCSST